MVISIVIPSFYPAVIYGGTIFASLNNARVLTHLGHIVKVSTTNTNMNGRLDVPTGQFIEMEKNLFVKYYNETIVDKLSISLLFNLWRDIKKAEIVHVQAIFNTPVPAALFYSKLLKKPVLLSPHGVLGDWIMNHGLQFKKFWLNCFIRPFANNVFWHATSQQEKKEILYHFPKAKVVVIPNALELSEFKKYNTLTKSAFAEKYAQTIGEPHKIIVSMGRLQKKKGFDILINAFKNINNKYSNAYLFIAGDDEGEKTNLLDLIKKNQLENRVYLTGNLSGQDKVDFLANADLFVLPSHNENFGMVYAEALAVGTPIVTSKDTPWEEVEQLNCGKWVDNSEASITSAMEEMIQRDKQEAAKGASQIVSTFVSDNVAKEFEKILQIMVKKNA